tara:strand:- start:2569 stop:4011 length:1443 start_codon:yes stop_codon:yes gene_type:complete
MPEEGHGPHSRLDTPFQGVGARGVNNLASKLLLALLPPNAPFFRLNIDKYALANEGAPEELISEIETSLQQVEESVMSEISREAYRTAIHAALKHLIVTGNVLLYMPDEGGIRVFHLDRFVVDRDPMGNVLHIATKENLSYEAVDDEVKEALASSGGQPTDEIHLYTAACREGDNFVIYQDVNGVALPSSGGTVKADKNPFIPLRFSRIDGESYGRGYVEEYLGDLQSLEGLTRAIVEGSAAAAKVMFLVNPNGTTRARTLAESPSGAIVQGNAADVTTLQLNKVNDFRTAQASIQVISDRLGSAFLLTSGVVRNAERVTAEEIRMLSQELESALGGLYSLLSTEMQLPFVNRLMDVMKRKKKLPALPKDVVSPVIITGVEALGRGNDLQKLDLFLAGAAQVVGPQAVAEFVNVGEYFQRRATSLGIKTAGLVKSQEEMQAEQQQAQQMAMLQQVAPQGIKALSDQSIEQQRQQGAPEPE